MYNLGALLDSQLLLEEQMAAVARGTFVLLCLVHQLVPFLDWDAFYMGLLCYTHVTSLLTNCTDSE